MSYNICDLRRKDSNGFYYLDPPVFKRDFPQKLKFKKKLSDNLLLYGWDDISCLAGSAGLAVVDEHGMVIKARTVAIS